MQKWKLFRTETIGDFVKHLAITLGVLTIIAISYFYVYLPNATNHGDRVTVPNLIGLPSDKLDSVLEVSDLRYEINDTSFSEDYKPLEVIRQFPHVGSVVKPGRKIFVSINRVNPPTLPLPDLVEQSLINAQAIIKSNELKLGRIIYIPSPFSDLVLEMQVKGVKLDSGTRVTKGTIIDLIVGDGAGPNDLVVGNFVGYDLKSAQLLIAALNLHQGDLVVPDDVDTTGVQIFVFKQEPKAGDSVRVGDPVTLWIAPKDYAPKDSIEMEIKEN